MVIAYCLTVKSSVSNLNYYFYHQGISNYDGESAQCLRRILVRGIHQILPDARKAINPTQCPNAVVDDKLKVECENLIRFLRQSNGEPIKVK